jgi:hypothetical protein
LKTSIKSLKEKFKSSFLNQKKKLAKYQSMANYLNLVVTLKSMMPP